jgi:hypothetical protein
MDLEMAITQLVRDDEQWGDVIRTCVEWSSKEQSEGRPGEFRRDTIYYRLGRPKGAGPKLTPLVRIDLIEKTFVNAAGTPYYRLAREPREILNALSRAVARA